MPCRANVLTSWAAATAFAALSSAQAQSVRGTVVDSASGAPLNAFVAVLLDARGAVARGRPILSPGAERRGVLASRATTRVQETDGVDLVARVTDA